MRQRDLSIFSARRRTSDAEHYYKSVGWRFQMNCPVCDMSATDVTPPGMDGRAIDCANCEPFEISGSALSWYLSLDRASRRTEFDNARARARSGARPLILLPGYPLAVEKTDTTKQHIV